MKPKLVWVLICPYSVSTPSSVAVLLAYFIVGPPFQEAITEKQWRGDRLIRWKKANDNSVSCSASSFEENGGIDNLHQNRGSICRYCTVHTMYVCIKRVSMNTYSPLTYFMWKTGFFIKSRYVESFSDETIKEESLLYYLAYAVNPKDLRSKPTESRTTWLLL